MISDIGFVSAGQSAEVKIDTFNFTRYGLLQGKVITVSQDAIVREKPAARSAFPSNDMLVRCCRARLRS
jgi:hemolysin D